MAFFVLFQVTVIRLKRGPLIRIGIGLVYTFVGLVLFLTGVNVGFMPVGNYIGSQLGGLGYHWIIIPIGMVIGYFIVAAEPAVHVLNKQVYELTSGAIPPKALSTSLSIGVSASVGLAMLRIVLDIPILAFLLPGYLIAIVLSFFVYSDRLRLGRRCIGSHDRNVPSAACNGRVCCDGRKYCGECVRHRGHGRYDAAHHHSASRRGIQHP